MIEHVLRVQVFNNTFEDMGLFLAEQLRRLDSLLVGRGGATKIGGGSLRIFRTSVDGPIEEIEADRVNTATGNAEPDTIASRRMR